MDNVRKGIRFSPSLCLTHNCNLNCIYCYQQHDTNNHMSFETACKCIDEIFDHIPDDMDEVEVSFIGGEPLIEFELIKRIVDYTKRKKVKHPYIFYATTNGTLLDEEKKQYYLSRFRECSRVVNKVGGKEEKQSMGEIKKELIKKGYEI